MGTNNNNTWEILSNPAILKAIKAGVFSALVGSGWRTDAETVADRISDIKVILAEKYLAGFNPEKGKTLRGYVRMVAHTKTVSYVKLHVHRHDGAVGAIRIDCTDATGDDGNGSSTPNVIAESAPTPFERTEQKERLTAALEALEALERSHMEALLSGATSAAWAAQNGMSAVQANRHKKATIAKVSRLVAQ